MSERDLQEALDKHKAKLAGFDGLQYHRFTDRVRDVPRGTAVFDESVVYGYPRIGRILALSRGIKEQFEAPFWVEEKIDGFNVRVFRHGDRILALSRGGFVCPFTTDRLPDLMDLSIFDRHPDLVVCAEMAGPENPYIENSPPDVTEDVRLYVFDLMRLNEQGFLPQTEKVSFVESYNLPVTAMFGRFSHDDIPQLREILLQLNDEFREGVVLKEDSPDDRRAKYVTSNSNILDIRATANNMMDLPAEYFTNRILRLVLFLEEQGLGRPAELDQWLGAAFMDGLHEAVSQFEDQHKVYRTYRCRFRHKANAERLMAHLHGAKSHQVQISQRDLRPEGDYWVLEFDRVYPSMNGLLGHLLAGGVAFD